jgi:hypothetical protein
VPPSYPNHARPIQSVKAVVGVTLRILTRFQVVAILHFSDRTNLLLRQPTRAHRNRLPLPQSFARGKAWETTAVAQSWYKFPAS